VPRGLDVRGALVEDLVEERHRFQLAEFVIEVLGGVGAERSDCLFASIVGQ